MSKTGDCSDDHPIFRFAPSPNGYLHLGHALSALINFEMARAAGGRLLLRIEDIDAERCRPEFEQAIYEDLAWLGVTWERPVRRQSEHLDDYRAALAALEARGSIYPSFESRGEIARLVAERERSGPGRATPTARRSIPGMRAHVRRPSGGDAGSEASPMRCGSTLRPPWRGQGRSPGSRPGRTGRRDRHGRRRPADVGRRGAGAQGDPDQLPSRGSGRRRPSGDHAGGARAGPVLGRPVSTACCRHCSGSRHRCTITTG